MKFIVCFLFLLLTLGCTTSKNNYSLVSEDAALFNHVLAAQKVPKIDSIEQCARLYLIIPNFNFPTEKELLEELLARHPDANAILNFKITVTNFTVFFYTSTCLIAEGIPVKM